MGGGGQIQLKMAMSNIALSPVYLFQNPWEFEFQCAFSPFLCYLSINPVQQSVPHLQMNSYLIVCWFKWGIRKNF